LQQRAEWIKLSFTPTTIMNKRVILVTGTPCTGKTTISKQLTEKLDALYINLTEYAKEHRLKLADDRERKTIIIDEVKMRHRLTKTINAADKATIIIDGHYASAVTPAHLVFKVFVLRRNPKELRCFMEKCGFEGVKLWENLSAEILDICLVEAMQAHPGKVCELDVTGKTVEEVTHEIMDILEKGKKCYAGYVDWLGMLEREGLTDQYLKA
jgi:adenylate kinase